MNRRRFIIIVAGSALAVAAILGATYEALLAPTKRSSTSSSNSSSSSTTASTSSSSSSTRSGAISSRSVSVNVVSSSGGGRGGAIAFNPPPVGIGPLNQLVEWCAQDWQWLDSSHEHGLIPNPGGSIKGLGGWVYLLGGGTAIKYTQDHSFEPNECHKTAPIFLDIANFEGGIVIDSNTGLKYAEMGKIILNSYEALLEPGNPLFCNFLTDWKDQCFPPGTLVRVDNSFKPIETLKRGDRVLMHTGKFGTVEATKQMDSQDEELVEIVTSHFDLPVSSTRNHPYLAVQVASGGRPRGSGYELSLHQFVPAENLNIGDRLVLPIDRSEKDIGHLELCDYDEEARKLRRSPGNEQVRARIVTDSSLMEICGLFLADGWIEENSTVLFGFDDKDEQENRRLAIRVVDLLQDVFGLAAKIRCDDERKEWLVVAISKQLSMTLNSWFGPSSRDNSKEKIPDWIMQLPPYKQAQMLQTLMRNREAEARSRGQRRSNTMAPKFSTPSRIVADQVFALILRQNMIPWIACRTEETVGGANRSVVETVYDIGLVDPNSVNEGPSKGRATIDGDYLLVPITKIRRIPYHGKIYALDIDGDETYTVGVGYAVHNSILGYPIPSTNQNLNPGYSFTPSGGPITGSQMTLPDSTNYGVYSAAAYQSGTINPARHLVPNLANYPATPILSAFDESVYQAINEFLRQMWGVSSQLMASSAAQWSGDGFGGSSGPWRGEFLGQFLSVYRIVKPVLAQKGSPLPSSVATVAAQVERTMWAIQALPGNNGGIPAQYSGTYPNYTVSRPPDNETSISGAYPYAYTWHQRVRNAALSGMYNSNSNPGVSNNQNSIIVKGSPTPDGSSL